MECVKVSFPIDHAVNNPLRNEVLRNTDLLVRLRSRGIPVVGSISLIGVERGRLVIERDNDFEEYVFTYFPPEEVEDDDDPAAGL